tara:strand:- start:251 stop:679 length:429 start_codon:yes stop_codon:yes gene_type:complete
MNTIALTSEETMVKVNNSFKTIVWGPGTWTENRTDGVVKSITVVIKGWLTDSAPTINKTTSSEEMVKHVDWTQAGTITSVPFTWYVPNDLQTTATWHGHQHPHNEANDDTYLPLMKQWLTLIKATDKYTEEYNSVISQLEAL